MCRGGAVYVLHLYIVDSGAQPERSTVRMYTAYARRRMAESSNLNRCMTQESVYFVFVLVRERQYSIKYDAVPLSEEPLLIIVYRRRVSERPETGPVGESYKKYPTWDQQ